MQRIICHNSQLLGKATHLQRSLMHLPASSANCHDFDTILAIAYKYGQQWQYFYIIVTKMETPLMLRLILKINQGWCYELKT